MSYEALCEAAANLDIDKYNKLKATCNPMKNWKPGDGSYETPLKYLPRSCGVEDMAKAAQLVKIIKSHIIDTLMEDSNLSSRGIGSISFDVAGSVTVKEKIDDRDFEVGLSKGIASIAKSGSDIRPLDRGLIGDALDNLIADRDNMSLPPLFFCMDHGDSDPFECIRRNAEILFELGYRNVCYEFDKSKDLNQVISDLERTVVFSRRKGDTDVAMISENNLSFLRWLKTSSFSYYGMDADLGPLRGKPEILEAMDCLLEPREREMKEIISRSVKTTKGGTIVIMGAAHIGITSLLLRDLAIKGAQALCITSSVELYAMYLDFYANPRFNIGINTALVCKSDSDQVRYAKQDKCLWDALCDFGLWRTQENFPDYLHTRLDPERKFMYTDRTQKSILESGPVMGMRAICPFNVTFALSKDYKTHAQIRILEIKLLKDVLKWVKKYLPGNSFSLESQDGELWLVLSGLNDSKLTMPSRINLHHFDLALKGREKMIPVDEERFVPSALRYSRMLFSGQEVHAQRTEDYQVDLCIGPEGGMPEREAKELQWQIQSEYNFPILPRLTEIVSTTGGRANVILPCVNSRNAETLYQAVKSRVSAPKRRAT